MDEDLQLALWCCYELHYRGFEGVPPELEWSPRLLVFRAGLEERWLAGLRTLPRRLPDRPEPGDVPAALKELVGGAGGPNLSGFLARRADRDQFAEFLIHRSVYQLKEADPHSFGIPRLDGAEKAALVEIQADEYGGGQPARMHAELFRDALRWLGLDDTYGSYVDRVPAVTLALSNLMSYFGLHRRWIGALLGHLAALEMTSTTPNRRYSNGARRLGATPAQRRYFDEHVVADAVHEQLAAHDLCGAFARRNPDAAGDVLFGAACCLALDEEFAAYLLEHWESGRSSLRGAEPLSLPA
jgi:heme oxygenase-like protein